MQEKRQYNLDLLRIFACFMVLILHVSAHNWNKTPTESINWQIFNIYDVSVRSAVPLFFMLSGSLFLSRDDISLKKLFSKNISKIVFTYFLWSFLYAVDTLGIGNIITYHDIYNLFHFTVASKYHLWYLPALFSVYLLIPVFISMKSYKNGKVFNYIALLFFIFAIVKYSILLLPIGASIKEVLQLFNFSFDSYCGYFLLGYILDKYKEKLKIIPSFVLILVFLLTVFITALGSFFLSIKAGHGVSTLYENFFISTFIEATIIFILFLRLSQLNISKTMEKIVKKLSSYTFFVYLFHPFILEHIELWFGLNTLTFSPIISVPTISILLFILCVSAALIIDKIPVIRKILL